MALIKKNIPKATKPKRYFLKERIMIGIADTPDQMKHKKCGGSPKLNSKGNVLQCLRCQREVFLDIGAGPNVIWKRLEAYNQHYYKMRETEVFPDKLEPAYRSVDKSDGARAFSSWELLSPEDLIKYHYGKEPKVIDG
jgi:hypothetical protein